MPIRPFLHRQNFDPETTRVLGVAFELVCIALRVGDCADDVKQAIANKVIALAKTGERNPDVLCERVLRDIRGEQRQAGTGSLAKLAPDKLQNRLLAALEPADYALLVPHLRTAQFAQGAVLQEQDAPVARVYFPLNGMVSLVSVMEKGQIVGTAVVGRGGVVGAFAGLGPWNTFTRATIQIPGTVAVICASHFQAAVRESERIRDLMLRYKEALLCQVQQTAACNALHHLEGRVARWLLQALDEADDHELPLTQESIAQMLGARRTTVTFVAGKLQESGLIRYRRGHIIVLDRAGLEEVACECYRAIRARTDKVIRAPRQFRRGPDFWSGLAVPPS
jgi:CRP-like cAMP-binding protein